ncbi:MAG: hypothetical protein NC489_18510 [Ruminococcus flavefaciens]|nr:hypothetical protein [Ruminococcus flavefaciens]
MAAYSKYKNLELPSSPERYNIQVFNKNIEVIDSELHKLDLKNESQDKLFASKESFNSHIENKNNPHNVTKDQLNLGNVDNTPDLDKPVSKAQRNAIDDMYAQMNTNVDIKISQLINGAPETLDTLKEIADAIKENETVVNALNSAIGNKINKGGEAGSCANDFILIIEESLLFIDNVCTILDDRITSHSLANVHFTTDTISIAEKADISVETYEGNVKLTAANSPEGNIKATIQIRVI